MASVVGMEAGRGTTPPAETASFQTLTSVIRKGAGGLAKLPSLASMQSWTRRK